MCRISYNPAPSTNFDERDLLGFFKKLEKTQGGHGNGIYEINSGKHERYVDNTMPSADIKGAFIFHTRIGTKGNKAVYNNQPFVGKRYVLAHNGSTYKLDDMALLLGFHKPDRKYSDSYMAHYIVEKVGILNFWFAMKDSSAGVFLIYDKVLKKTFLCKFSGVFEYSRFKDSTKVIYASSESDYWEVSETIRIDDGLYRLNEDGIDELDKKRTYSYGRQSHCQHAQTDYYGRTWDDIYDEYIPRKAKKKPPIIVVKPKNKNTIPKIKGLNDNIWDEIPYCYYCQDMFTNGQEIKIDWGFKVCLSCFEEYGDTAGIQTNALGLIISDEEDEEDDSEPVGIASLFPDMIPKFCKECNWLYEGHCWFGGGERDNFPSDAEFSTAVCHSNNPNTKNANISCDMCNSYLPIGGDWNMWRESMVCNKCQSEIRRQEAEEFVNLECHNCKWEARDISLMPCKKCYLEWDEDEQDKPPYWVEKIKCKSCGYFRSNAYPCKVCVNFNNWVDEIEDFGKCWYCGYHFDADDEAVEDMKGHRICSGCDDGSIDVTWYTNREYYRQRGG